MGGDLIYELTVSQFLSIQSQAQGLSNCISFRLFPSRFLKWRLCFSMFWFKLLSVSRLSGTKWFQVTYCLCFSQTFAFGFSLLGSLVKGQVSEYHDVSANSCWSLKYHIISISLRFSFLREPGTRASQSIMLSQFLCRSQSVLSQAFSVSPSWAVWHKARA